MWNRLRLLSEQFLIRSQRGQALVLIALAFIGLAAFIGLTVDAGILFSNIGHLRRATDAASLAAANQFREGRYPVELSDMAFEMLELNGLTPLGVVAKVCDLASPGSFYDEPGLCPGETNPPSCLPLPCSPETPRKYVRVESELQVNFAFLPLVGFNSTVIRANSISEAASIDVVLSIDVSDSMAIDLCYDLRDNDVDGVIDECAETTDPDSTGTNAIYEDDIPACVAAVDPLDKCHPFEEVRDAAKQFVDKMYFPYDRVSIVTFGRLPTVWLELDAADSLGFLQPQGICNPYTGPEACAQDVLDNIQVLPKPLNGGNAATDCDIGGTPRGCMTTNIGEGLRHSGGRFCIDDNGNLVCDRPEMREEAVWIVILLTDGAANAATSATPPATFNDWICPANTYSSPPGTEPSPPWCRDGSAGTRHPSGDPDYDADDYAHDMADFVGCPNPNLPQPVDGSCASTAPGGQGAVIFTIGLGSNVISNPEDPGEPRAGEFLLRYAAAVGDDGWPTTDFCTLPNPDVGPGLDCGNYYYSPSGAGLIRVFEAIASRIFTRITH